MLPISHSRKKNKAWQEKIKGFLIQEQKKKE
jgi:hypothetical protein